MQIGTRFTEYAMTGAFFWLSQVLLFVLYAGDADAIDWASHLEQVSAVLALFPAPFQESAATLLATVGIIAIFVAGVLLDLLPSLFFYPQMVAFRNGVERHAAWLEPMCQRCGGPALQDFHNLRDKVPSFPIAIDWRGVRSLGYYASWRRMQALLFSFVDTRSKGMGELYDHMHLWRTSRALGNTMLLLALEVLFVYHLASWALVVHLGLYAIAWLITLLSYHRLCYDLFSLACTIASPPDTAVKPGDDRPEPA